MLPTKSENVAAPRSVSVYPSTSDEARKMLDQERDEKRQWMLTAKILHDENVKLVGLLAAERRKHAPKG